MASFRIFRSKQAEVLSHWYTLVPSFQTSTRGFYAAVEQELKARQVPGLEVSRVEFSEGGLFSAKRLYLRLTRERLVFDICAAPFGTSYFFSCRFAELPLICFKEVLFLLIVLSIVWGASVRHFGLFLGSIALLTNTLFIIWLLRNTVSFISWNLDSKLLRIPVIGKVYERFFSKETYYRVDTRLMYLETVPAVVKDIVQQVTAANGITLLKHHERKPILGELYQSTLTHMVVEPPAPQPEPQPEPQLVPVPRPVVVPESAS